MTRHFLSRKKQTLFKVFTLISSFAFAAPQVTKIEAEFVCAVGATSQHSFNMKPGAERIWMSSPNAIEGIPLKVLKLDRARCPGCYSIKADWDNGVFQFTISGNQIKVIASGNPDDPDAQTIESSGTCRSAK
jgi:hypothetical protein